MTAQRLLRSFELFAVESNPATALRWMRGCPFQVSLQTAGADEPLPTATLNCFVFASVFRHVVVQPFLGREITPTLAATRFYRERCCF